MYLSEDEELICNTGRKQLSPHKINNKKDLINGLYITDISAANTYTRVWLTYISVYLCVVSCLFVASMKLEFELSVKCST